MTVRPIARAALLALACCVIAHPAAARKLSNYDASASNTGSGVPRFVSANDASVRKSIAKAQTAPQTPADHEAQARAHLRNLAATYHISASEVDALPLLDLQTFPQGGSIVRFRNRIDGIDVFREEAKVLQDKAGNLVAIGGFVMGVQPQPRKTTDAPDIAREDAVGRALAEHGFAATVAQSFTSLKNESGYTWLSSTAAAADGSSLAAPVRVKRVWFRMASGLTPAWY